jgi:DNA repair protein RecN (Recombination protein N)
MVFDEIDTGVSGSIAESIALKMKKISSNCQVLAITHLPQVASYAKYHDYIYKEEHDGRTFTHIKELTGDERCLEIAKMISGAKVSDYAINLAKELLMEGEK